MTFPHQNTQENPASSRKGKDLRPTVAGAFAVYQRSLPVHFLPLLNQKPQPAQKGDKTWLKTVQTGRKEAATLLMGPDTKRCPLVKGDSPHSCVGPLKSCQLVMDMELANLHAGQEPSIF